MLMWVCSKEDVICNLDESSLSAVSESKGSKSLWRWEAASLSRILLMNGRFDFGYQGSSKVF